MEEITRTPLTFGQLSTWRSIYQLPPEAAVSANLVRGWRLPDGCDLDAVRAALDAMQQRHESLRTGFARIGDDDLEQVLCQVPRAPVSVIDAPGDPWTTVLEVAATYSARLFDLAAELPWLLTVVRADGQPAYVVMSLHHMAGDGAALDILRDELIRSLSGDVPAAPAKTCRAMATEQRSPEWEARRTAAVRYWQATIGAATAPTVPPDAAGFVQWSTLRSIPAARAARELSATLRVSVTTTVLAAYCLTLAERLGTEELLLGVIAANRAEPHTRGMVTTLNQLMPLRVRLGREEELPALAQRLHWETLRAYRHGCYNVDDLAPLTKDSGFDGVGAGFVHFFNFMPTMSGASDEANQQSPGAEGWDITTTTRGRNNGFASYFRGHDGPLLECTLRENSPHQDSDLARAQLTATTETFLRAFHERILSAAASRGAVDPR